MYISLCPNLCFSFMSESRGSFISGSGTHSHFLHIPYTALAFEKHFPLSIRASTPLFNHNDYLLFPFGPPPPATIPPPPHRRNPPPPTPLTTTNPLLQPNLPPDPHPPERRLPPRHHPLQPLLPHPRQPPTPNILHHHPPLKRPQNTLRQHLQPSSNPNLDLPLPHLDSQRVDPRN